MSGFGNLPALLPWCNGLLLAMSLFFGGWEAGGGRGEGVKWAAVSLYFYHAVVVFLQLCLVWVCLRQCRVLAISLHYVIGSVVFLQQCLVSVFLQRCLVSVFLQQRLVSVFLQQCLVLAVSLHCYLALVAEGAG